MRERRKATSGTAAGRSAGSAPAAPGSRRARTPSGSRGAGRRAASETSSSLPRPERKVRSSPSTNGRSAAGRLVRVQPVFAGLSTGRALIMAMVTCVLALTLAVPLRTYFGQNAETTRLSAERAQLDVDLKQLRDKKAQQQDPAYVRAQARSRLRLVEPGATPYVVQLPGAYEASLPPAPAPPKPTGPWYSRLWKEVAAPRNTTLPLVETPPPVPSPQPPGQVK